MRFAKRIIVRMGRKLPPSETITLPDLAGYVDVFGSEIEGWALDQSSPFEAVTVCIDVDDQRVVKVLADVERADITSSFVSGAHGFRVDISEFLSFGNNKVKVYIDGRTEPLPRGCGLIEVKPRSHQVAIGENGWLFLQNDGNDVRSMLQRTVEADDEAVTRFLRQSLYRASVISSFGAEYLQLIVPEKHVIYEEHLPTGWMINPNRKAATLARIGKIKQLPIHYLDGDLVQASRKVQSYYKNDTHWCWSGRRVMLNAVCEIFKLHASLRCTWIIDQMEIQGDLASKLEDCPPETVTELMPDPDWADIMIDRVNDAKESGQRLTESCVYLKRRRDLESGPKLLLLGTSSCYNCCLGFLSIFSEVLFVFDMRFDADIFKLYDATHVIVLTTERYLNPTEDDFGCRYTLDRAVIEALTGTSDARASVATRGAS